MKVSIVYLFFTLCASVAATGIRGSAERAFIFSIYMQEEIFDDPTKDGGIATGCVGSRTGLRGQQNRCTLRELCEYIWAPTNQYNTKPDPAKMSWPSWTAAMADEIWSAGERTVAEALAIVVQNVDEKDRKGKKKVYYNGYWDASKVLPGFSSTASEYYRAARELGDWQVAARKTIEAQLAGDSLSDEQKRLFKNWNMESERAVKLVLGLRRKDLNEFVIKQMRRPLYFGRLIARTLMTDYEEFVKMDGAKQPDRGGTITMYEQGYPGGRAQLIADYDAAINLMMQTQDNRLHRRAIVSWRHSSNRMKSCK